MGSRREERENRIRESTDNTEQDKNGHLWMGTNYICIPLQLSVFYFLIPLSKNEASEENQSLFLPRVAGFKTGLT